MKGNIILVGFMGTGKTAVGKRLAALLNKDFYDTDREVETVTGMSISQLYSKYGEVRFRSEENLAIKRLVNNDNCIIALGGGVVLDKKITELISENGIIICLTAKPEIIYERVKRRNNRPFLKKGNMYNTILDLLDKREELYKCADYTVDTSDLNFQEIIDNIMEYLKGDMKNNNEVGVSK